MCDINQTQFEQDVMAIFFSVTLSKLLWHQLCETNKKSNFAVAIPNLKVASFKF